MPVRSFLRYALTIPDQSRGRDFYTDFGFHDAGSSGSIVRLQPPALASDQILLYEGPQKRLRYLVFGAVGDDFETTRRALEEHDVALEDPPEGADGGLWFRDPDGNLVNVRSELPTDLPVEAASPFNGPGSRPRVGVRAVNPPMRSARPRRLGHVMLFSPDIGRQRRFYSEVLGLRISDDVPGIVTFLRCNSDHHNLAFIRSHRPGFHHASFEVGDIDEIAVGAQRMDEKGWELGWGLGRHCIGSNFFYYIKDPWGSYAEYFFDLDCILDDDAWVPKEWDPEFALYVWGPPVPSDFETNIEEWT
jgi:catechol 2,3-dioxygenase-like lactoylglutathione lyase family enzyme